MQSLFVINFILIWIIILFNLILTMALVRQVNKLINAGTGLGRAQVEALKNGEPAPHFTASTLDGNLAILSNYINQSVLLIFVSSHCKPCREKIPAIEKVSPKALVAGVNIIYVCVDDMETSTAFLKEFDISSQVLVAPLETNSFLTDYKVPATPYFYLIEQGVVQEGGFFDDKWFTLVTKWNN
jgi:peroxiredoxin